jgi:hypothetical protein
MPGMLTTLGLRIDAVDKRGEPYRSGRYYDDFGELQHTREYEPDPLPDLTDHATLGCLLPLVREAWGDPCIGIEYDLVCGIWLPVRGVGWNLQVTALAGELTEGAALVAALEAAP